MEPATQLEQAIVELLRGQNVSAANAFILDMSGKAEGWAAAMLCVQRSSSDDAVRYFAANLLYSLVRKQWAQLGAQQQREVYVFLSQLVLDVGGSNPTTNVRKQFLGRCVLAFCCVCARAPEGIKHYIDSALSLIDLKMYPIVAPHTMLGLEMLVVVGTSGADEGADDTTNPTAVHEQLLSAFNAVLQIVDAVAATLTTRQHQQEQQQQKQHEGANKRLRDIVIRLVQAWLSHGVTLSKAFEEHQHLVALLWMTVQHGAPDDSGGAVLALILLKNLAEIDEFPRPSSRTSAITAVAQLLQSTAALLAAMADDDDGGGVAHAVCDCAVSLVAKETAVLADPSTASVEFFQFLLYVCSTDRKLAALGFEAWICLQDLPVASRHPFLQRAVFGHVLTMVFGLCSYPPGFTSCDAHVDVDENDFENFRDHKQGVQDLLLCCFSALQESFIDFVAQQLLRAGLLLSTDGGCPLSAAVWDTAVLMRSWNVLEAALFVLQAAMGEVKEFLADTVAAAPQQFLLEFTRAVIGIRLDQSNLPLLETATKYLGSCTFLLVGSWKEIYFQSVDFLFGVLLAIGRATGASAQQLSTIERHAAKSIHQLVVRGSLLFTNQQQQVVELVKSCGTVITVYCEGRVLLQPAETTTGGSYHDSVLLMVECVIRTVAAAVTPQVAGTLACSIGNTRLLASALALPGRGGAEARADFLLGIATQIIRFLDAGHRGHHVLAPFLTELWPLLSMVPPHPVLGKSHVVMSRFFSTLRSLLGNAKELVTAHLPSIVDVIATYVERTLLVSEQQQATASISSFECGAVAVEVLGTTTASSSTQLAHSLLSRLTAAIQIENVDADTAASFFGFVYNFIIFFPAAISKVPFVFV